MGDDRSNPDMREGYYGSPPYYSGDRNVVDAPAPVPAASPAATPVAQESPFQRRWVPPQPPGVAMAEAAAAIRQPRSLPRQESQPAVGAGDASRPSDSAGNEHMEAGTSDVANVESPSSSAAAETMDGAANGVNSEGAGVA
jgi:peroxin-14